MPISILKDSKAADPAPAIKRVFGLLEARSDDRRPVRTLSPSDARQRYDRLWEELWNADVPWISKVVDVAIVAEGGGSITARIYNPDADGLAPIVFIHGGGFVLGGISTHDGIARRLSLYSGRPVVSIDYRCAPEHPFPTPLRDCGTVVEALIHGRLPVSSSAFAIAGDSAGANLALALSLNLRNQRLQMPTALALLYGCFDPSMSEVRAEYGTGQYGLSTEDMKWFWTQYLGERVGSPPDEVALLNADLQGLCPCFIAAAECDILARDSERLHLRMMQAGVQSEFIMWAGMVHGFLGWSRHLNQSDSSIAQAAQWLRSKLTEAANGHTS